MLVGVRGALEAVGADWVNVQVGGITLQVFVPASEFPVSAASANLCACTRCCESRTSSPCCTAFPTLGQWSYSEP